MLGRQAGLTGKLAVDLLVNAAMNSKLATLVGLAAWAGGGARCVRRDSLQVCW